ncbi:isopenicillin N synthase family dioxygenase [Tatumella saanichensis]|uniref:isopenicillin N synthase family dioxygenase n=1 Tax=Tatumella saanichensis TaxID=480813 RepID=UPI0004A3CE50|nr:isopenicillin N synthase family oxygenase [Tatumella saanichensis]
MTEFIKTPLPIIDFSQLKGNEDQRNELLAQLRTAAREVGFFYLTGHGVASQLCAEVQQISRRFFALPEADKLTVRMANSPHFRGYNRAGVEITRSQPDFREQFDIGADRPVNNDPSAPLWRKMQGPNQWPAMLPELKTIVTRWQVEMTRVALELLRAFAVALSLPRDAFDELYGDAPNEHIKLIRYPGRTQHESRQGVGAHKDSGFLTLLLQDEQGGLQVEVTPNNWVDVQPLAETFVVNIGELLELATNGYLRATVHRVISPRATQQRLSVAFFLGAQLDRVVPIYQLPSELAAAARGPVSDPLNPLLREVGWNYLKGRIRSHPEVANRFYSQYRNK